MKMLGCPVFTRPEEYEGLAVPKVLTEGNHRLITKFRRQEAIKKTMENRPELLEDLELDEDKEILNRLREEDDKENYNENNKLE